VQKEPQRHKGHKEIKKIFVSFVSLWLALLLPACRPDPPNESPISEYKVSGQLQIYMLDVGQGDSLLIITPERKTVLIDAGLSKAGDKILETLSRYKIDHIDLAVATHPHADHIGGMPKVLTAMPVKIFLDSGQAYPTASYEKLLVTIKEKIGSLEVARAGQEFELDSGAKLQVLGPSDPLLVNVRGSNENANSVVLRLTFGHFRMLFTGDIEEETEQRLIEAGVDLRAQVLKVAHHGSQNATTEEFLNRVQPQFALISCGEDNDYGHPSQETLDRLYRFGAQLHRTDLEGDITIITDGSGFQVTTEHEPVGDLWAGRRIKPQRHKEHKDF
jgi:competence protein ComEC